MGSLGDSPPIIDLAPYFNGNREEKSSVVLQIKQACLNNGFFQITNHGVPDDIQQQMFEQSKAFFELPTEEKMKYNKDKNMYGRGYECLRSQNFEKKTAGDLKEGFYLGRNAEQKHFSSALKKYSTGPNLYPRTVPDPEKFKATMDEYHTHLTKLAETILRILAVTLDKPQSWFDEFIQEPIATLRLLHYPPQPPNASADERGIGAHTDFGAVTILLQDDVGGLQVYEKTSESWIDVQPTPGAFVVNLGNLMMRWTNDRYISNLHRVINKTGKERYSIPFFFSGNPEFEVKCIPGREQPGDKPKYDPVTVQSWHDARFADTYGSAPQSAQGDLVQIPK